MSARRFRTEIAGVVRVGLEFDGDRELEEFLAGRGLVAEPMAKPAQPQLEADEPHRGRPSFGAMLEAAVRTLRRELRGCKSLSARARRVLRHLAQTHAAQDIPSTRTVTAYLAERRVGNKVGNKVGRKSKRGRMARTGGLNA